MLHVVSLPTDQASEVEHNTLGLITLSEYGRVGVLEGGELLLVALALPLKLFSNLLLEDKRLEGVVTLLLRTRKTDRKTSGVILLLLNERGETTSFTLVVLNLDLEILGLLGKLFGEGLEFEELRNISSRRYYPRQGGTYLLLPALKLLDKEVISFGNLAELGIHATLEIDEILPRLQGIPGILIALAHNFVKVTHRNLGHKRLLDSPTKDGFHAGISSLL
jgi:hypothetical protein